MANVFLSLTPASSASASAWPSAVSVINPRMCCKWSTSSLLSVNLTTRSIRMVALSGWLMKFQRVSMASEGGKPDFGSGSPARVRNH